MRCVEICWFHGLKMPNLLKRNQWCWLGIVGFMLWGNHCLKVGAAKDSKILNSALMADAEVGHDGEQANTEVGHDGVLL